jgi:YfiH family protein
MTQIKKQSYIEADWLAPKNVKALVTTRLGGVSESIYDSFNLAEHVDDQLSHVKENRLILQKELELAYQPFWLEQVHSSVCVNCSDIDLSKDKLIQADASYSSKPHQVSVVMTADCLPILLTNRQGNWIAACHAGWRGLASGVIQNTINCYAGEKTDLMAWIGPAISQKHFEVGNEVREIFLKLNSQYECFFEANSNQRYQFDFIGLARQLLESMCIDVYGGTLCSYADNKQFYSYRRDGRTGRMASLIWFE